MLEVKKIRVEYSRDPKLKPLATQGVYGGPSSRNTIEMNFFSETDVQEKELDLIMDSNGVPVCETPEDPDMPVRMHRRVHTRLVINRECAHEIIKWLTDVVSYMESIDQQIADEEEAMMQEMAALHEKKPGGGRGRKKK